MLVGGKWKKTGQDFHEEVINLLPTVLGKVMISVSAANFIWLSLVILTLAYLWLCFLKLWSHVCFLYNSLLAPGVMKNSWFCPLLLTPSYVTLYFGESLCSLLWVSFHAGFTGVQCLSSAGFWSFLFHKFIVGALGTLPAAGCPCALYHKILTSPKRLGNSPIFSLPHSHFSLPVTSPGIERLWYFESKLHTPPAFLGLAICPVPCFDKMHFFSDDEKVKVVTFWVLNVDRPFFSFFSEQIPVFCHNPPHVMYSCSQLNKITI